MVSNGSFSFFLSIIFSPVFPLMNGPSLAVPNHYVDARPGTGFAISDCILSSLATSATIISMDFELTQPSFCCRMA